MRRRLLNLVTAVPLLLCVAVAALRARSYSAADGVALGSGTHGVPDGPVFMPGVQLISFSGYLNVQGHPRLELDTVGWRRQWGGRRPTLKGTASGNRTWCSVIGVAWDPELSPLLGR